MPITSSDDVYRALVDPEDISWLYGLVAFAVVEEQRVEWMRHTEKETGEKPDSQAVEKWYRQQPDGVLLRAKGTAESALKLYADEVLQQVLEVERREMLKGAVLSRINALNSFWPQFGKNVVAGIVSSLIFAAILTIVAFIVFRDASPIALGAGK